MLNKGGKVETKDILKGECICLHPPFLLLDKLLLPCKTGKKFEFYLLPAGRSVIILTQNVLFLGPSNSQKYMACQVPRTRLPPATGIVCDDPIILALRWAAELPSAWRYFRCSQGISSSKYASMSLATSGSAPSLIVIPAVVCGQYTQTRPSRILASLTAFSTFPVMLIICERRSVLRLYFCSILSLRRPVFQ